MIGEIDVYGVFVPTLLLWVVLALALAAGLRRVLRRCGSYYFVWHRPLFDLALLVVVLGVVAALANWWV